MKEPMTVGDALKGLWGDKWWILSISALSVAADHYSILVGWVIVISGAAFLVKRQNRRWNSRVK